MSADGSDDPPANMTAFSAERIRAKVVPDGATDDQSRIITTAIRNPDAMVAQIAHATDTTPSQVLHTLTGLSLGADFNAAPTWGESGGRNRMAESYDELTEKQRAIVDYFLVHPGDAARVMDADADLTSEDVARTVNASPKYGGETTVSGRYPYYILSGRAGNMTEIIAEERERRNFSGEADGADATGERPRFSSTPRETLAGTPFVLPDTCLDGVDDGPRATRTGETEPVTNDDDSEPDHDDTDMSDTTTDDGDVLATISGDDGPGSEGWVWTTRRRGGKPYYFRVTRDGALAYSPGAYGMDRLPGDAEGDDVEMGSLYLAVVNGVEEYGIFVSLTPPLERQYDVTGLVPREELPEDVGEYSPGDVVVVRLTDRTSHGLKFTLARKVESAAETERKARQTDVVAPQDAPHPDDAQDTAVDTDADSDDQADADDDQDRDQDQDDTDDESDDTDADVQTALAGATAKYDTAAPSMKPESKSGIHDALTYLKRELDGLRALLAADGAADFQPASASGDADDGDETVRKPWQFDSETGLSTADADEIRARLSDVEGVADDALAATETLDEDTGELAASLTDAVDSLRDRVDSLEADVADGVETDDRVTMKLESLDDFLNDVASAVDDLHHGQSEVHGRLDGLADRVDALEAADTPAADGGAAETVGNPAALDELVSFADRKRDEALDKAGDDADNPDDILVGFADMFDRFGDMARDARDGQPTNTVDVDPFGDDFDRLIARLVQLRRQGFTVTDAKDDADGTTVGLSVTLDRD